MELRRLRYFVAVAEELNFGRAALRLHIAQPPLSQQILKLEDEIGVKLFNRDRHKVELTYAGRQFLHQARIVLNEASRAAVVARRAERGEIGQLEIGYIPSADLYMLPRFLLLLKRRFPDVSVVLRNLSGTWLLDALRDGRLRIAVLRLPLSDSTGLKTLCVQKEKLIAVLPADHRLAARKRVSLRDLAGESFVLFPRHFAPRYYDSIAQACQSHGGFTLEVAQEADTIQTTLGLVAAGLGVSIQSDSVQNLGRAGVIYRPLAEKLPEVSLGIAYRADDDSTMLQTALSVAKEI